jgi:hypothetical protein
MANNEQKQYVIDNVVSGFGLLNGHNPGIFQLKTPPRLLVTRDTADQITGARLVVDDIDLVTSMCWCGGLECRACEITRDLHVYHQQLICRMKCNAQRGCPMCKS